MSEALYYKEHDNKLYLRAKGHVTAALCADLRERVFSRLDAEPSITAMYVDLSECEYMDSTFMGLLVGFNKRLIKAGKDRLILVNPTLVAKDLISGLGLNSLVTILYEELSFPEGMEDVYKTRSAGVELLLKAHENLMEISEDNRKKFATLHAVLENQTKKKLIANS
ncbi:hypothetical protein MASR2M78_16660 [Treponema sp.]